jgi:hypothetical protein
MVTVSFSIKLVAVQASGDAHMKLHLLCGLAPGLHSHFGGAGLLSCYL